MARTMVAHGAHSELAIVPLERQRCHALGTPGDPTLPQGAERFARFCDDANYTSMNHTQGFSSMVEPLARFLVAAVGDHVAPDEVMRAPRRLYELTVGLVSAAIAGACSSSPAMNESASGESLVGARGATLVFAAA